jgi:hypothetical protein
MEGCPVIPECPALVGVRALAGDQSNEMRAFMEKKQ